MKEMEEELIIAYLLDDCSPGERVRVETWINDSPENKKDFEEMKVIWENSGNDYSGIRFNADISWNKIWEAVSKERSASVGYKRISGRAFLRVAASIVLLVGLGYLSFRIISNNGILSTELIIVETSVEKSEVELPDGSCAWLNKNSSINYPERFASRSREVRLTGEAYFEVSKNRRKPFIVSTDHSRIEVLGTSFNVNSGIPDRNVIVSVVTGRVALSGIGDPLERIILEPGEQGIHSFADGSLQKARKTDTNFLAWKTGILIFENTSLTEVCNILSDHYDQPILVERPDLIEPKMLSATFNNKELGEILKIITMTHDVSLRSEDEEVILSPQN